VRITLFYIPVNAESDATALGNKTIELRLAACANIFPIQSVFPWENSINHEGEFVLILKTIPFLEKMVRDFFSEHHPYDVPCIMSWEVEVNSSYGEWIMKNVLAE
jgi:periplasmic divalent cation tolerance protein